MTVAVPSPTSLIARFSGRNGVEVDVHDESSPYGYANLFRVCLRLVARVPGSAQAHERTLERLGVPTADVERLREDLLDRFRRTTLPYLFRPDFPQRYSEYRSKARGALLRFPVSK